MASKSRASATSCSTQNVTAQLSTDMVELLTGRRYGHRTLAACADANAFGEHAARRADEHRVLPPVPGALSPLLSRERGPPLHSPALGARYSSGVVLPTRLGRARLAHRCCPCAPIDQSVESCAFGLRAHAMRPAASDRRASRPEETRREPDGRLPG
jgi:hypothetical protein